MDGLTTTFTEDDPQVPDSAPTRHIGNAFLHECAVDALRFHISQLSDPAYEYKDSWPIRPKRSPWVPSS